MIATPAAESPPDGEITAEVRAFVSSLQFAAGDKRNILGDIAIRLAQRVDAKGASAAAARELRVQLAQLGEIPELPAGPDDGVDGIRAGRAVRRLDGLIGRAA